MAPAPPRNCRSSGPRARAWWSSGGEAACLGRAIPRSLSRVFSVCWFQFTSLPDLSAIRCSKSFRSLEFVIGSVMLVGMREVVWGTEVGTLSGSGRRARAREGAGPAGGYQAGQQGQAGSARRFALAGGCRGGVELDLRDSPRGMGCRGVNRSGTQTEDQGREPVTSPGRLGTGYEEDFVSSRRPSLESTVDRSVSSPGHSPTMARGSLAGSTTGLSGSDLTFRRDV